MKNLRAFTLAEVLITLGVIGVIAALTLPALIQKYQEKQTVVKLKKELSIFQQAYNMALQNYGTPDNWEIIGNRNAEGAKNIYDILSQYLKIAKNCEQNEGCFAQGYYKRVGGSDWTTIDDDFSGLKLHRFILADGTLAYIQTRSASCESNGFECAFIGIDINGKNKPNTFGKDLFIFILTKNGIIPRGMQNTTGSSFDDECKIKESGVTNGWACAAWVIYNENMDYLHCNDLSWEGKHKCD